VRLTSPDAGDDVLSSLSSRMSSEEGEGAQLRGSRPGGPGSGNQRAQEADERREQGWQHIPAQDGEDRCS
jgi:hypothetical protein